ncbi:MAG TPA: pyridoxal-phosphate dependent enzyme, partial [Rudaea sp.]|nr:pyridoxal-phosphate dependent enzyme [Rudaea sp.]
MTTSSTDTASARPILVEGDPRLLVRATPVDALDASVRSDLDALGSTLALHRERHGFGRGIAAPQIGIARRMIVIDLGAGPIALINPQITWRSEDSFVVWDDCFSVPDRLVRVRRDCSISLTYRDAQFRERVWRRLPPDLSELLQHEIDHLDGVLMTQRATGPDAIRPATERALLIDQARAGHRFSLQHIAEAARGIDPVFRDTPLFESEPLSALAGCRLALKVETLNPLRSFKGRGAGYLMNRRLARAERGPIVCASAGNFGQAMAYICRRHDVALTVFAAETANALKVDRMRALGADVRLLGADFDAAKEGARAFAATTGTTMIEDGFDPAIAEGAGSIGVELLARGDAWDAIVVPLGDGALLGGVARWIKAASPSTEVIGVVARGASAFARSWRNGYGGAIVVDSAISTIADGIALRAPIPEAVAALHGIVDDVVEVDDPT